ncbi:MAG: AI-2E family transporter [Bacteroidales bacterium]|nr:AI-2E family transporter [Bacteroidales bacterium]MCM1147639.1 AI-2E family transporter [Bacteroidales bacterium]MCM1206430.1 AI-2E family transporter [Bacillota bacterium]MCM1509163.1 AI-2E family transporter [Clostridium sp.]
MLQNEITFDRFIRWVMTAFLIAAVFFTVNYLSSALLPFFVAWGLAYLLFPIVTFVERVMRIRIRALAIIVTVIIVAVVLTGVTLAIIPPMIDQFQKLGVIATSYIHQRAHISSIPQALNELFVTYRTEIDQFFRSKDFSELVKHSAPGVLNVVTETFSFIKSFVGSCITLLYMFFILLDYEKLTEAWVKMFPIQNRPFVQALMRDVSVAMNSYIRGQALVALTMGILFCIGFTIIGFPMAIGLGILIGILDLVPYLHTFALIPTAFLALMKAADTGQNFWVIFASAFAIFAIVQIIIDMIVTPKIMGKAMGMNPAILLLSLSVWGSLLGFIGLIIALPLTTIILAYWKRYVLGDTEILCNTESLPPTKAKETAESI